MSLDKWIPADLVNSAKAHFRPLVIVPLVGMYIVRLFLWGSDSSAILLLKSYNGYFDIVLALLSCIAIIIFWDFLKTAAVQRKRNSETKKERDEFLDRIAQLSVTEWVTLSYMAYSRTSKYRAPQNCSGLQALGFCYIFSRRSMIRAKTGVLDAVRNYSPYISSKSSQKCRADFVRRYEGGSENETFEIIPRDKLGLDVNN